MTTVVPAEFRADPGSFRDPAGQVFQFGDRVLRAISRDAAPHYEFIRDSGLLGKLVGDGKLVAATERVTDPAWAEVLPAGTALVVEHPKLPFISYPYEWSFRALQRAALLHLDLHLSLLERGATLSDATAFNVQYNGPDPVFIDLLSIRRYSEGEFWFGHRQFCEQFLNPLLLQAWMGIPFHEWYRGRLEGLPSDAIAALLPWWRQLSPRALIHVSLQAKGQKRAGGKPVDLSGKQFPKAAFVHMLRGLSKWISTLDRPGHEETTWGQYAESNSYDPDQARAKQVSVRSFVEKYKPRLMYDIGCNTGDFSQLALQAGANLVVGFDADHGALDRAARRAEKDRLNFIPLWMDLANPSPSQGWAQRERLGLQGRANTDAAIALAVVHHLAIGRNVPLGRIAEWLMNLAPVVLVEFVPKDDPMVQLMLKNRPDIFPDYDLDSFRKSLNEFGEVISETQVGDRGRTLLEVRCAAPPTRPPISR